MPTDFPGSLKRSGQKVEKAKPLQTEVSDGNFPEQQLTQSAKPSEGHPLTHVSRSAPSSAPVQDSEHLSLHSLTQSAKTEASVGHSLIHASKEPPIGDGEGEGEGDGVGVGAGGVGAGAGAV